MIQPIAAYGNPVLKQRATEITPDSVDLKALIADMYETMYNAHGVGLAAPQINLPIRVFITDGAPMVEREEGTESLELKKFKKVFINPIILEETGESWGYEEGCLSIPGIREVVYRPSKIKIQYWDEHWQNQTEEYTGLCARIIQHEYDHLEGILFTDHISPIRKQLIRPKLLKIQKASINAGYPLLFPVKSS